MGSKSAGGTGTGLAAGAAGGLGGMLGTQDAQTTAETVVGNALAGAGGYVGFVAGTPAGPFGQAVGSFVGGYVGGKAGVAAGRSVPQAIENAKPGPPISETIKSFIDSAIGKAAPRDSGPGKAQEASTPSGHPSGYGFNGLEGTETATSPDGSATAIGAGLAAMGHGYRVRASGPFSLAETSKDPRREKHFAFLQEHSKSIRKLRLLIPLNAIYLFAAVSQSVACLPDKGELASASIERLDSMVRPLIECKKNSIVKPKSLTCSFDGLHVVFGWNEDEPGLPYSVVFIRPEKPASASVIKLSQVLDIIMTQPRTIRLSRIPEFDLADLITGRAPMPLSSFDFSWSECSVVANKSLETVIITTLNGELKR